MHWVDRRDGKLIVGNAAYGQAMEQSFPGDIVSLPEVLDSHESLLADVEVTERIYDVSEYTADELRDYCRWILGVVATANAEPVIKARHISRLSALGLGPGIPFIKRELGVSSMHELGEQVGAEKTYSAPGAFAHMKLKDYIDYGQRLTDKLGHKPTVNEYADEARNGFGPGPAVILNATGLYISQLNDLLGFPAVKRMSNNELLDWGAEVRRVNDIDTLTRFVINALATRRRGPGQTTLVRRFGSISGFNHAIDEVAAIDRTGEESPTLTTPHSVESPPKYLGHYIPDDPAEREKFMARLAVAKVSLPQLSDTELISIAYETTSDTLADYLLDENSHLSIKDIVYAARWTRTYQLLWGNREIHSPLFVSDEELEQKRAVNREAVNKYHRYKQSLNSYPPGL